MVITREKFSAAKPAGTVPAGLAPETRCTCIKINDAKAKKQGAQNIPKVAEITFVNFLHF
jgi:hypothetical protein